MAASRIYHKLMKALEAANDELGNLDAIEREGITVEDEKKVMCLILDCMGLLVGMQQEKQQFEIDKRVLQNQIFLATLSSLEKNFMHAWDASRGYQPLQDDQMGIPGTTDRSLQLMRSFHMYRPEDRDSSVNMSALHIACRYGTPTVKLLQYLLQLDTSQVHISGGNNYHSRNTPLEHLCYKMIEKNENDAELPFVDLVNCLLVPDKSNKQCQDAVLECLVHPHFHRRHWSTKPLDPVDENHRSRLLWVLEVLLKASPTVDQGTGSMLTRVAGNVMNRADPDLCIDVMKLVLAYDNEAAKRVDDNGVALHYAIQHRPQLHPLGVIQFLLDHNKDAVKVVDKYGRLPVHIAAGEGTFQVMKLLLDVFPEGANVIPNSPCDQNLLQVALEDREKVEYLCSKYPAMLKRRNDCGYLPIHTTVKRDYFNYSIMRIICEAGGLEQLKIPVIHPTDTEDYRKGYLPLHVFLHGHSEYFNGDKTENDRVEQADALRYLLRMYPEAAGIVAGAGNEPLTRPMNPYQMALTWCERIPKQYLRLLLRAAPTLDPVALQLRSASYGNVCGLSCGCRCWGKETAVGSVTFRTS